METLPAGTDLDLCYVTAPGGTRALLNTLVNSGTAQVVVPAAGTGTVGLSWPC